MQTNALYKHKNVIIYARSAFKSFPGELAGPNMLTKFPGPKTQASMKTFDERMDNRAILFPVDLSKSIGNYIADPDGNQYLDVFGNIATVAVGYNHPELLNLHKDEMMQRLMATRPALGIHPHMEWADCVEDTLMSVAPKGMDTVFNTMCGSCSVEVAYKLAFMHAAHLGRGGRDHNELELSSCMNN